MSAPNFVNKKIIGFAYTEDNYPYSSKFRPPIYANLTSFTQILVGSSPTMPSSTNLFYEFFYNTFGYPPTYPSVMVWAAFDILESVLYHAAIDAVANKIIHISPASVLKLLRIVECSTPLGSVTFDSNRINTAAQSIFVQTLIASNSIDSDTTSEIIGPSIMQTASFVYPMPSWDERVYQWTLLGTEAKRISAFFSSLMNAFLLAIMITVFVNRADKAIRVFYHIHVILFCLSAMIFCWGNALLYQNDMNQSQCDSYLWVLVLSASFFLSINNMKAYRLSIFLTTSTNGKRPKPYSHGKVLKYTMVMVSITAALLLIIALADPPKSTRYD